MIDKTYKCPMCGSDMTVNVYKIFKKPETYNYVLHCPVYACNMPLNVAVLDEKPDNIEAADRLYSYMIETFEEWKKKNEHK